MSSKIFFTKYMFVCTDTVSLYQVLGLIQNSSLHCPILARHNNTYLVLVVIDDRSSLSPNDKLIIHFETPTSFCEIFKTNADGGGGVAGRVWMDVVRLYYPRVAIPQKRVFFNPNDNNVD